MEQFRGQNLKLILNFTVFICGAAVMMVELIGSRLLAPYVGSSLIPWTALIGVILGSLSLGYWQGGKIADKNPSLKKLSLLIFLSGLSVVFLLWQSLFLDSLTNFLLKAGLIFTSLVSSVFLFFLPSFLLGMIMPYVLRLAIVEINDAGKISGALYACSTLGSIIGTFAAGFIFIPFLGSIKTLTIIAMILISLSWLLPDMGFKKFFSIIIIIGIIPAWLPLNIFKVSAKVIDDQESFYNRLLVVKNNDIVSSRPILSLISAPHIGQSARFIDNSNDLVFDYTKFFRLVNYYLPYNHKVLMIGGGAYSVPRDYLNNNQDGTIDVVEIDPLYTELARKYFDLKDDERLNIYHQDARWFLKNKTLSYDAIFVDAFNGSGSVPFHLTTKEAIQSIFNSLNNQGIVIVNLIGSTNGAGSQFIQAEFLTYRDVFPKVKIFALGKTNDKLQNIMLVAFKGDKFSLEAPLNNELVKFINQEVLDFSPDSKILTDDWAPVDYWLAGVY